MRATDSNFYLVLAMRSFNRGPPMIPHRGTDPAEITISSGQDMGNGKCGVDVKICQMIYIIWWNMMEVWWNPGKDLGIEAQNRLDTLRSSGRWSPMAQTDFSRVWWHQQIFSWAYPHYSIIRLIRILFRYHDIFIGLNITQYNMI
jgi:hypothetical protein